ncbi:MAG: alpha/beta hydrolase [Xanthobacteraceae bacterium]|uniref:alpha/beta hydrolase n=1 Tax=Pseudolabrys sp. TaxID=1960880 RepID=UPI003D0C17F8
MRARNGLKAAVVIAVIVAAVAASVVYIAFQVSPWPSALLLRHAFNKGGAAMAQALEKHVPPGVTALTDQHYDPADGDAYLDVFAPTPSGAAGPLPLVVWVHGGGWLSGSKSDVANYAKIIAAKGYVVASLDYSLAPGATFPAPVRQINAALKYLAANAQRLRLDPRRIVLAGDSAGAHLVAVTANAIAVPEYADAIGVTPAIARAQLAGVVLFCGPYALDTLRLAGPFGKMVRTMLWSFSGNADFRDDPVFANAWVLNFVGRDFPPAFISVGNADALAPQSVALADRLAARGVRVERLFFPQDRQPPLRHEYQFDLDSAGGKQALDAMLGFLKRVTAPE